jgi:hypothetical protein
MLSQVPWPLHQSGRLAQKSLPHTPVAASQTSGAAAFIAAGPSTTAGPACAPLQVGHSPSHGSGTALYTGPSVSLAPARLALWQKTMAVAA